MYLFYEVIKKEVDLQDLVDYLDHPLEKLKLLQIKLQEYKSQNIAENKIEIEELIRETDKLEKTLFPDLINNYCKLSLEFRNNTIIKQIKDKSGNIVNYTSKDLLLKNIAKLIEHINLMDEKFYKYFSFEFLVNSRIISDLGYQENYIDNKYEPIILKNQYVFSKEDAKKTIDTQLKSNEQTKSGKSPLPLNKLPNNGAALLQPKAVESTQHEEIFEKKIQPVEKTLSQNNAETNSGSGVSLIEIMLVGGMISILTVGTFALYNQVSNKSKQYEEKIKQERLINQIQLANQDEQKDEMKTTQDILAQLAKNKEKNNLSYDASVEHTYKQVTILMTKIIDWKKMTENASVNNAQISFNALDNFYTENGQMLVSPRDMIDNGKAYRIDVIDGKAQLKISNLSNNECKYTTLKSGNTYNIQANEKPVDVDNMNEVCKIENNLLISEK